MSKIVERIVATDGARGFFDRAREHVRKLDRREIPAPEVVVTFKDAGEMPACAPDQIVPPLMGLSLR